VRAIPASPEAARRIEPVWETLPGWCQDTTGIRRWEDLPAPALAYLERVGSIVGTEVALVGVGPDREQSIVKPGSWLARQLGR
jgi:adenylosuccinate synthase